MKNSILKPQKDFTESKDWVKKIRKEMEDRFPKPVSLTRLKTSFYKKATPLPSPSKLSHSQIN